MADLDKFVLEYEVNTKDAVARLDKLNQKVEGVAKESAKTRGALKEFASGSADELGRLVPGIDKISSAVKLLGAEFAMAGLAVAALGIGIKSVMDMRAQYNAQRTAGMEAGVSGVRMEEYSRKFVRGSNGTVSRDAAIDGVKTFQQMISKAYTDPTRLNAESRELKLLGIDPGARGKGSTNVNDAMTQLATRFQKMTPAQVQGVAKSVGMNQDWALTLQKLGPAIGKITEQTEAELKARQGTADQFAKFNDAMAKTNEKFVEAENVLSQKFLPALTKLVEFLGEASVKAAKVTAKNTDRVDQFTQKPSAGGWLSNVFHLSPLGMGLDWLLQPKKDETAPTHTTSGKVDSGPNKSLATTKSAADKIVDGLDEANKQGAQTADDLTLAVNMFAGAVASFSNAVDERQAWAAWAGEIGKASGLGSPAGATGSQEVNSKAPTVGPTKYDPIFNAAAAKTGLDVNLIKNVARVESQFDPNAESKKGAQGLMQILPSNFKSLGIKNGFDPEQSVMGGAQLLKKYIEETGDVRKGLMMYHAGYDKSGYGPLTRAYPGKVLGNGISRYPQELLDSQAAADARADSQRVKGESRDKMARLSVQQNIANRLGVPVGQIQLGGVSRGDVAFADSQLQGGIQNNISNLQRESQQVGLPQTVRSKILTEIRDQQRGLATMQQYGGQVEDKAPQGPRSITIGERAVIINVTGSGNPEAVAQHVHEQFSTHFADVVNAASDGIKY